jgi:hypothetical protein
VIAIGTMTTAMRGALPKAVYDKLPLEAKNDLRVARKRKSKKPPEPPADSGDRVTPTDAPRPRPVPLPPIGDKMVGIALVLALTGCATPNEPPPCDPASYAKLSLECGDDEAVCDKALEDREAYCAKKIEADK